jgi:hypothetical protein
VQPRSPEGWKTARAAIRGGWGPTLRLLVITTAPTVPMTLFAVLVVRK